ncbi:MAG TPA: TIGR03790 family protein, partial [Candidatus Limnocylindria bacterium]|nr:TIGR03790 family protein [Candidatus Limnocylindria bacterium]
MTIPTRLSRTILTALLATFWLAADGGRALADGGEVVVVYTRQLTDSKKVAEYYAEKRGVPADQVIGLDVPSGDTISRPDYVRQIQDPLLKALADRGLMTFRSELVPARADHPGRIKYQAVSSKIRYLALCFGLPYRIAHDPNYVPKRDDDAPDNVAPQLLRDEASVDSELTLLPVAGQVPIFGALRNGLYGATNSTLLNPTNGVLLVSRLDGPTMEIAQGLVDKALQAERDGLNGRAYFDLRNITSGGYATGDQWITNASIVARRLGFETLVDNRGETIGPGFPLAQVAIYAGWYNDTANGPFALPSVEFMPGAIAYHLHSFSAYAIRDPVHNWVGPLLAKGAAVTLGCVDEPYLDLTPNIGAFLERLAVQGFTVGEAGLVCQPFLSWQNVVLGDPLYRPFGKPVLTLAKELGDAHSPLLAWALIRKVNVYLLTGRDPEILRQYLMEQPLATNSPVLSEKIARMFADKNRNRQAVEWGQRALKLPDGSPQQRARLWRDLAEWQRPLDRKGAMASLESFAKEFPHHPDLLEFRRRELDFAIDLSSQNDITRLKAEILTLTPPPPTNAP